MKKDLNKVTIVADQLNNRFNTKEAAMSPNDILKQCESIMEQRANYGEFEITAFRSSRLQSIIWEEPRTPEGFCIDMVVNKLARLHGDPNHLDSYIDAICYLAQAAAIVATDWNDLDSSAS